VNNLNRVGGLSALLFSLLQIAGLALSTTAYASAPAQIFEVGNVELRIAVVASFSPTQRLFLTVGSNLELLAVVFLVPPLVALYVLLKREHLTNAILAAALGLVGIPFLVLSHLQRFPILELGRRYGLADSAGKAGLVALFALGENFTLITERVFLLFFGLAIYLVSRAMLRAAFPRWLAVFGVVTGTVTIVGAIGATVSPQLELLQGLAALLVVIWHVWIGLVLYRQREEAA
jgi:hypothetical protein